MKKYYIYTDTDSFRKNNGKYEFNGSTSMNPNDEFRKVYDDYEEAIKNYNSIKLRKEEDKYAAYGDYKQLFSFTNEDITDKDIEDDNLDISKMEFLKDEFTIQDGDFYE